MSQLDVTCPNCNKRMRVPEDAVGRKVRCKACDHAFVVPDDDAPPPARPVAAKPVKPTAAKPVAAKPATAKPVAKPVAAKPATPADADAPIGFAPDEPAGGGDDEDGPNEYGVTKDDLDIPRCPFCAHEMDPPDALVCLNCGYDMTARKRHGSKRTYKTTGGDVFMYWLPAVIWVIVLVFMIATTTVVILNVEAWMKEGQWLEKEDTNQITNKKEYWVGAGCYDMCCILVTLGIAVPAVRTLWIRLRHPKPPEEEKKK